LAIGQGSGKEEHQTQAAQGTTADAGINFRHVNFHIGSPSKIRELSGKKAIPRLESPLICLFKKNNGIG
jgi:hypothetical protein